MSDMSGGKSLKDRVCSFQRTLQILAFDPGRMPVEENRQAREFYEKWLALNDECIKSGTFRSDTTSFVSDQLLQLLVDWRSDIMEISIFHIFPIEGAGMSAFLFGDYLNELNQVS
jgi:hypothetical protein